METIMSTCLVIVDVQDGFLATSHDASSALLPHRIITHCNTHTYDHVVATRFVNHEGSRFCRMGWHGGLLTPESQRLAGGIADVCERAFDKSGYSCWTPEFCRFVRDNSIRDVWFCGLDTEACVLMSAVDAFEHDMRVHVLEDLCVSTYGGAIAHRAGIIAMSDMLGADAIVTSD